MSPDVDTIAAIATAPGAAGLAVVRVSGPDALAVADAVFEGRTRPSEADANTLHHGWAKEPGSATRVDEVVAAIFRAPRSYTREDVVEFSCHGGRLPAARLLDALLAAGARLARPGEFTLRAFLHGRLDLAQAEAVADLIDAETESARALALSQLGGELSRRLDALTESLADAAAEVEARVDFVEDVGGVEVPRHVIDAIAAGRRALDDLLAGAAYARAVREGVRASLVGRPNVGKSSLFNALVGEARAIVTERPGTTRDVVSEPIEIAGVRVTLADTAGLRDADDPVERLGVERAEAALDGSALVVWVVDGAAALTADDLAIARRLAGRRIVVALNKRDVAARVTAADVAACLAPASIVEVSAKTGAGVACLCGALADCMGAGRDAAPGGLAGAVGTPRHAEALERARASMTRAAAAADEGRPGEIVAVDLREALRSIGEVTGRSVDVALLDRVFERFCIGK